MEGTGCTIVKSRARIDNLALTILREMTTRHNEVAKETTHTHSYTELFFCLSGSLSVCTENEIFHVYPEEMLLVPPNIRHYALVASDNGRFTTFGIFAERCSDGNEHDLYSRFAGMLNESVRLYNDTGRIASLLTEILDTAEPIRKAYLNAQFLFRFSSLSYINAAAAPFVPKSVASSQDYDRIIRLETLINCTFNQNLTLEKMAASLYLSKRQLARVVKKYYGMPLHKIIMRKRMEAAEKLLVSTTQSAELIGQKVGYESKSSFYREFSEYFGTTPTKYRHTHTEPQ